MNKALLPAGFHDLLFPEAGAQANLVEKISKHFENNGYQMVAPPAIEFEKTLFAGAGKALESQTFRLMDPMSHSMMGVRADMTLQIARIAETRLVGESVPIRLSYAGDVFRVKGEGLYAERQFTHAGIELIGVNNIYADAEVIIVALKVLKDAGIQDLCVDFTIPGLLEILLEDYQEKDSDKEKLLLAIKKKDMAMILKFGGRKAKLLAELTDPEINIKSLAKLKLPEKADVLFKRLKDVIDIVENKLKAIHISIDPLEVTASDYHSGIGFSIFSKNAKEEIGRGGRYLADNNVSCIGVTLYVNELLRILPKPTQKEKVFLPFGTSLKQMDKLHSKGFITINALEKHQDSKKEARRLECQYLWEDGNLASL